MTSNITSAGRLLLAGPGIALASSVYVPPPVGAGSTGGSSNGAGPSGLTNVAILGGGQSNAFYANDNDGALGALATATAFYLGAASSAPLSGGISGVGTPGTDYIGAGSYPISSSEAYPMFLQWNGAFTAAAAATAALGVGGADYVAFIAALTSAQRSAIQAVFWYWGETDALYYQYANKDVFKAAYKNLIAAVRAAVGKTAAQLPWYVCGPPYAINIVYANQSVMEREAWAELAADPTQNCVWVMQQGYDNISRNDTWNASTGVASGGNTDGGHRAAADNVAMYKRCALAVARGALAANGLSVALIPAALGTGTGPQIATAKLAGATVTLTIQHDGGTDLVVPLLAAQGVGFTVMDGGSPASPGNLIQATACSRIDSTHLLVTLASAPSNAAAACRLMYPWPCEYWAAQPDVEIGRGCAVTDNFATLTKPAGFDINAALGAGWGANMPLCSPVSVVSGIATYGLPLS